MTFPFSSSSVPPVSVLMPVFNAQAYLPAALQSIQRQTWEDFECICVDDGSTDDSLRILMDYRQQDERIRIVSRPNTGIVGALNDGLQACRGELVARMDADDTCDPTRFARQVAYLQAHPRCVAVGSWVLRTDPFGSPAGEIHPPTDHAEIDAQLLRGEGSAVVHASTIMRREALLQVKGWHAQFNWVEDLDLFLRLAEVGELANLPETLYHYRRHESSVCYQKFQTMRQRAEEVLRQTHQRRGLPGEVDLEPIRKRLEHTASTADIYRSWACHAIQQGNGKLALRHALVALRKEPFSLESWRVMRWALAA